MPTSAIIITVAVLAGVLLTDLGRRAVTTTRLLRPLLVVAVVGGSYLSGFATGGTGLALEVAGIAAGAVLGVLAAGLMRIEQAPGEDRVYTRAGVTYALVWIVVMGARLAFIYGTTHWLSADLASWMRSNQVTVDALTDALVLMAMAMAVARTVAIAVRSRTSPVLEQRHVGAARNDI